jgi:hypothetical protein
MAAVKTLIPLSTHAPIDERLIAETSRRIADIRATPEAQEGLAAFLEKRKPAWVQSAVQPAKKATRKQAARTPARNPAVKRAR